MKIHRRDQRDRRATWGISLLIPALRELGDRSSVCGDEINRLFIEVTK